MVMLVKAWDMEWAAWKHNVTYSNEHAVIRTVMGLPDAL